MLCLQYDPAGLVHSGQATDGLSGLRPGHQGLNVCTCKPFPVCLAFTIQTQQQQYGLLQTSFRERTQEGEGKVREPEAQLQQSGHVLAFTANPGLCCSPSLQLCFCLVRVPTWVLNIFSHLGHPSRVLVALPSRAGVLPLVLLSFHVGVALGCRGQACGAWVGLGVAGPDGVGQGNLCRRWDKVD